MNFHGALLPLFLQLVFFVVLVLEFILPSAGVLTTIALISLVASWWLVLSSTVSWLFSAVLVADIILIPITLFYGFRMLRKSAIANAADLSHEEGFMTQGDLPVELVGKLGLSQSMLKPWGKVEVEGQAFDATSTGDYIEPGTKVRVLGVSQNKLTVETFIEEK